MNGSQSARGNSRRRQLGLVGLVLGSSLVAASAAQASTSWGGLYDYNGGNLVASASGTYFYAGSKIQQTSTYQDRRADSYGAYTQANFQPFWHSCSPDPASCRWEWGGITTRQTARITTSSGVRTGYGVVDRVWPTNRDYAQVCIDIPLHADPCVNSGVLNP
jgi:hypothetical protein